MTVQNEIVNMEDEVRSFPDKREEYRMHRVDLYDAQMKQLEISPTHSIMIHIAGDYNVAIQLCRSYCTHTPLCVTVTSTKYVYSGGMEEGVTVRDALENNKPITVVVGMGATPLVSPR